MVNRCLRHYPQVIREARYHAGDAALAPMYMGQIETESRCNSDVVAFDGGVGLGQFMPATAAWIHGREEALQDLSSSPLPHDPTWSIRALILYDLHLIDQVACAAWWAALRAYNGGPTLLNREIARAGSCDQVAVARSCQRKKIRLKNGGILDLCRVNCEYPSKIAAAAAKYRRFSD